jgi:hypothetical protein
MKKKWIAASWLSVLVITLLLLDEGDPAAETELPLSQTIQIEMDPVPLLENAERIGINLSGWSTWGAEQISANVLMNPGFEGDIDRILVISTSSDEESFSDEKNWGYADDYWKDAEFEIRSGTSAGMKGKIVKSLRSNSAGFPQYFVEGKMPPIAIKDVISLTKTTNTNPVPIWWIAERSKDKVKVDLAEKRPDSPGIQSLALTTTPEHSTEIDFYLDASAERVGRLLNVEGQWKFSLWAKGVGDQSLKIILARLNGTPAFLQEELHLTHDWKEYVFNFTPQDKGAPQVIKLSLEASGAHGRVWLDDIYLGPLQPDPDMHIRHEVIDILKKIKPSFIRDTQGQLGDSFQNRIADLFARRAVSGRAYAGERGVTMLYSIPDLLAVCKATQANPWIVLPPTFSDEEAFQFGQYLALHADKQTFKEVIVEFGNENWNWMFRATGIPYPEQHGLVADRIFQLIAKGANEQAALQFAVNGQAVNPDLSIDFLRYSAKATILGIAPYIFYKLNKDSPPQASLEELFHEETAPLAQTVHKAQALNKAVAVYEVNLHTTQSDAPALERDPYTVGHAAGSALSKRLLESMLLKIQPQIVFTLLQYDSFTADIHDTVKLWGIFRDVGVTSRMRPQALALQMLNQVIGGQLYRAVPVTENTYSKNLVMAIFKNEGRLTAAAVNANEIPLHISWKIPQGNEKTPNELWVLEANSPFETNEEKEDVRIVKTALQLDEQQGTLSFTIPAWGFVVLTGGEPN